MANCVVRSPTVGDSQAGKAPKMMWSRLESEQSGLANIDRAQEAFITFSASETVKVVLLPWD